MPKCRWTIAFGLMQLITMGAQGAMSQSEMLLSGVRQVSNVNELPAEIDLPTVWTERLRELAKRSRETTAVGTEYGACLNFIAAELGGGKAQAMSDYQNLLKNRANLAVEEFQRESTRLRRVISLPAVNDAPSVRWIAGEAQVGNDSSIRIVHDGPKCPGEVVGDVHTHPDNSEEVIFSGTDIVGFFASKNISRIVVNNIESVCLLLKTAEAMPGDFNMMVDVNAEILPFYWAGDKSNGNRRTAWFILNKGAGLYCGMLGGPLKPADPAFVPPPMPASFYILAAKAYLLQLEQLNQIPVAVSESFLPQLDKTFVNYLTDVLPKRKGILKLGSMQLEKNKITPEHVYRYAVSHVSESSIKNGDIIQYAYNASCFNFPSGGICTLANNIRAKNAGRTFAFYAEETGLSALVTGNELTGFRLLRINPQEEEVYEGQCTFVEIICRPNGRGILNSTHGVYDGEFLNGRMHGYGLWQPKDSKQRFSVKFNNGKMMESQNAQ